VNKLTNFGKRLSTNRQNDVNDSSNMMALENLVEIEVAEEIGRVENIEQEMAEENLPVAVKKLRYDPKPLKGKLYHKSI